MIVRVNSGDDGQSHFEDIDLPDRDLAPVLLQAGAEMAFRYFPEGDFNDWHNESRRQYAIILSGEAEFQVGDGSVRTLGPGGVFLGEDLTGQGHTTRMTKGPSVVVFIPLP
jgi:hypothetical protein